MSTLVASKAIWYLMRASGVVSLLLTTGVLALGIATSKRWSPPTMPRFVTASLHRNVALLSVVFVAIHVLSAVLDPYAVVGIAAVFVPFVAGRSAFWVGLGALSLDLVAALIVSSLMRAHLGLRVWRSIHWLAYLAWPFALAHALGMGSDTGTLWLRAVAGACIAMILVLLCWRLRGRERRPKRLEPRTARLRQLAAEELRP